MSIRKILVLCFFCVISVGGCHLLYNKLVAHDLQVLCNSDEFSSIIIESKSIKDVLDYVKDQRTLVVFDLDNTLFYPKQDLGGDAWFSHLVKQKTSGGMSYEDAITAVLPVFFDVQNRLSLYPVEDETPFVLATLLEQKIVSLGLTSRSLPLMQRTHAQLKEAGLQLTYTPIFDRDVSFDFNRPARLNHGIMFCNNVNKGTVLVHVLHECDFKPTTVIFVDDRLNHLLEVQKECLENKMHFVGIRYGRLDEFVAQFDPARAEEQFAALLHGIDTSGSPMPLPGA